jgi:hypothetical protein
MKDIHSNTPAHPAVRQAVPGGPVPMTRMGSFGVRQMYADLQQMQTQLLALRAASDRFLASAI